MRHQIPKTERALVAHLQSRDTIDHLPGSDFMFHSESGGDANAQETPVAWVETVR